jgi:hypothetical protein
VGENPTAIFYISQRATYREFTNGSEPKIREIRKEQPKRLNMYKFTKSS